MLEEVTQLIGLQIYTRNGVDIGTVANIIVDVGTGSKKADALYVEEPNPALVEAAHSISIPFRWVQSIGDIIVLKHFPDRVMLTEEERQKLYMAQQMGVPEVQ